MCARLTQLVTTDTNTKSKSPLKRKTTNVTEPIANKVSYTRAPITRNHTEIPLDKLESPKGLSLPKSSKTQQHHMLCSGAEPCPQRSNGKGERWT